MSLELPRDTDTRVSPLVGESLVFHVRHTEVSVRSLVSDHGILLVSVPLFLVLVKTVTSTVPKSTRRFTVLDRRETMPLVKLRLTLLPSPSLQWEVSSVTEKSTKTGS